MDVAGIADRERAIHDQRSIRRHRRANGTNRYVVDTDIESGAFWDDLYDKLTAPRRGGPRFIDEADKSWAESIATDERTTDQYAHDAFTQLLRIAVDADHKDNSHVVGSRLPAVRVLITADALERQFGHGNVEGTYLPVSVQTVERIICTSGTVPIVFDSNGQPLDLGREQRLFSAAQRVVLASRDGGCIWLGCDRPPSWTEAHHIDHWTRDRGKTNVNDGVLLCRHHHMLLHNNGWEISREDSVYWLVPPASVDPNRTPRKLESKSAVLRELLGTKGIA